MIDHWTHSGPPVYIAVAGYLGLIKEKKKTGEAQYGNLEDLAAMFGDTGGMIQ